VRAKEAPSSSPIVPPWSREPLLPLLLLPLLLLPLVVLPLVVLLLPP